MDSIRRKNKVLDAIWCVVLVVAGAAIAFTVNADSYLARYYDVFWYMVMELIVTVFTVVSTAVWWHLATSESVRVQGVRMWISENGLWASLLSSLPVWLVASVAHIVCSTAYTLDNSGYRIYSVFVLPFLYMALTFGLPPVEISETILPGGRIVRGIARGVLVAVMFACVGWILVYDFG